MTSLADLQSNGHVPEIEAEVLGALLLDGSIAPVLGTVQAKHFLEPLHRRIFENIQLASERFRSCRFDLVHKLFPVDEREWWAKQIGMPLSSYLSNLATRHTAFGTAGLGKSVKNLLEQWGRCILVEGARMIAAAAADPGADPVGLLRTATREFDDIAAGMKTGARARTRYSFGEAKNAALDDIRLARERGNGISGVTWGLSDINRLTGGLHRGEMVVLGARPGMGKTAVAGSIALKAAKAGAGVAFVSLEMGAKALLKRSLTDLAYDRGVQLPYTDLITGRVSEDDLQRLEAATADFSDLPLWIEDQSGLSLSDLKVKVDRIRDAAALRGHSIDLLIVDYLQLLAPSGRYAGNRVQEVTELSAGLRNLGREEGFSVLALSQLNRSIESRPLHERRPTLADLRESGSIEQDADTVAFLFREAYYLANEKGRDADAEADRLDRLIDCQNKLEFIIAKQRNGPVKTVDLFIDVACSAVRNSAGAM